VALVADDYGLTPGIGRAIRALAGAARISGLSVMSLSPHWPAEAKALAELDARVDVGLHLTLTELAPLGPMPVLAPAGPLPGLGGLLARSFAGALDRQEIAAEIERQFDRFESHWGRPPDHVDGHQHVHVLPQVAAPLAAAIARRAPRAWVRRVGGPPLSAARQSPSPLRAAIIAWLGLRGEGVFQAFAGNAGFSGVRGFDEKAPYASLMAAALGGAGAGHLVMCHPGSGPGDDPADVISKARAGEFAFLAGDDWPALLAARGLVLTRLSEKSV